MTAAFTSFYPWVLANCSGVPNPVMDDAIRRGAREFCKVSQALIGDVTVTTANATQDYAPTLSAGSEVISLLSVKRSASESLTSRTREYIDAQTASSGAPTEYCVLDTDPLSIRFRPTPTSIENLTAKFVLMPTETATVVDSKLLDWWVEGVTAYAKYWLKSMSEKAWTDTTGAAFAYRQFLTQASQALVRKNQGYANLPVQVQMRPFA